MTDNRLARRLGAIGAVLLAALFVGFFAFKVRAMPLIVIVCACLVLMAYVFWQDERNGADGPS